MARLIDDLLSLSRIELNAHLRPDNAGRSPVRSCGRWSMRCRRWRAIAASRSRSTAPTEPLIVPGDRDELIRVFENLIENALKYGASGKRVEITLSRACTASGRPEAVVAVRDYGPGIAAEHLPRLTERFYRVDVADSRAQGGTGLGPRARQAHPQPPSRAAVDREPGRARARPSPCGCRYPAGASLSTAAKSLDISAACAVISCHLSVIEAQRRSRPTRRGQAGGSATTDTHITAPAHNEGEIP